MYVLSTGINQMQRFHVPVPPPLPRLPSAPLPCHPVSCQDHLHMEILAPETLGKGDAQGMYDLLENNMHDMYMEAGWDWNKGEKWREMEHRHARFLIARCSGEGEGGTERVVPAEEHKEASPGDSHRQASRTPSPREGGDGDGSSGAPTSAGGAEAREERPAGEGSRGGRRIAGYCHFRFAWDEDENEDGEGVGGKEDVLYVYELQVAPWATRRGLGRRMMQVVQVRDIGRRIEGGRLRKMFG